MHVLGLPSVVYAGARSIYSLNDVINELDLTVINNCAIVIDNIAQVIEKSISLRGILPRPNDIITPRNILNGRPDY